jgi:hypothetical protein
MTPSQPVALPVGAEVYVKFAEAEGPRWCEVVVSETDGGVATLRLEGGEGVAAVIVVERVPGEEVG